MTLPRIGVFDSGVGGLTVLKAMAEQIAGALLLFWRHCATALRHQVRRHRGALCHRRDPFSGIPEHRSAGHRLQHRNRAGPAADQSRPPRFRWSAWSSRERPWRRKSASSRSAIVIATEATVSSHAYRDALQQHGLEALREGLPAVCSAGRRRMDRPSRDRAGGADLPRRGNGASSDAADVLVLACTHYPLIAPLLRRITPEQLKIVDSAESTARVVRACCSISRHRSSRRDHRDVEHCAAPPDHRSFRFFVTDSVDKFKRPGHPLPGTPG